MAAEPGAGQGREQPGRRSSSFRPDRLTELEGTLGYYEVFSPSIAPFKRVSALSSVVLDKATPVLRAGQAGRTPVPIEGAGAAPPDSRPRDRFWGSVVLDFSEGQRLPLPSVSPESRLLEVIVEPQVGLAFERDGADNFFVTAREPGTPQVRLTYLTDAPRSYFGAPLPAGRIDALAAEVPPLPASVRRAGLRFASELGLTPGSEAAEALRTLVAHFRSFEESKLPPRNTGQIYLDLAREKRGVCRHRAYAFVITAQALGVPSRFVQNEAHAWAELKLPQLGWMRVDLGGAAEGLETHAGVARPMYRPRAPDPWPRPPAFERSYSRAAQLAARRAAGGRLSRGAAQARRVDDARVLPTLASGQSVMSTPSLEDGRAPTYLQVTQYGPDVMRGDVLELSGNAQTASGSGIAGLRIEVSLASTVEARAVLLGVSVTDDEGRFRAAFTVPSQLEPDDYALVVVTPGNAQQAAARAL